MQRVLRINPHVNEIYVYLHFQIKMKGLPSDVRIIPVTTYFGADVPSLRDTWEICKWWRNSTKLYEFCHYLYIYHVSPDDGLYGSKSVVSGIAKTFVSVKYRIPPPRIVFVSTVKRILPLGFVVTNRTFISAVRKKCVYSRFLYLRIRRLCLTINLDICVHHRRKTFGTLASAMGESRYDPKVSIIPTIKNAVLRVGNGLCRFLRNVGN
jgi:hypothetical protein